MAKTSGAANIKPFEEQASITTKSASNVKHLVSLGKPPLVKFKNFLKHQKNFLEWIESRHELLTVCQKELHSLNGTLPIHGPKTAKDATYTKYQWYAGQLVLLAALNAFEVYYKETMIALGELLHEYIPPEKVKYNVDAKMLWRLGNGSSIPVLIFETELFHDLNNIDKATELLVSAKFYNQNEPAKDRKKQVSALRALFQIRHTLSHNSGHVTHSDATKFRILGYEITENEIIDPMSGRLRESVFKTLVSESECFTAWLGDRTVDYLLKIERGCGVKIAAAKKAQFEELLGKGANWNIINWL